MAIPENCPIAEICKLLSARGWSTGPEKLPTLTRNISPLTRVDIATFSENLQEALSCFRVNRSSCIMSNWGQEMLSAIIEPLRVAKFGNN